MREDSSDSSGHAANGRAASNGSHPRVHFDGRWPDDVRQQVAEALGRLEVQLEEVHPVPAELGAAWTCLREEHGDGHTLYIASRIYLSQVVVARDPGGLLTQLQALFHDGSAAALS